MHDEDAFWPSSEAPMTHDWTLDRNGTVLPDCSIIFYNVLQCVRVIHRIFGTVNLQQMVLQASQKNLNHNFHQFKSICRILNKWLARRGLSNVNFTSITWTTNHMKFTFSGKPSQGKTFPDYFTLKMWPMVGDRASKPVRRYLLQQWVGLYQVFRLSLMVCRRKSWGMIAKRQTGEDGAEIWIVWVN